MCLHRVLKCSGIIFSTEDHFSYGQLRFEEPLDFLKNHTIYAVFLTSFQLVSLRNGLDLKKITYFEC